MYARTHARKHNNNFMSNLVNMKTRIEALSQSLSPSLHILREARGAKVRKFVSIYREQKTIYRLAKWWWWWWWCSLFVLFPSTGHPLAGQFIVDEIIDAEIVGLGI